MSMVVRFLAALLALGACSPTGYRVIASAPSGPWFQFIYAPISKTVYPRALKEIVGTVRDAQNLVSQTEAASRGGASLSGNQSWFTLDFGVEVRDLRGEYSIANSFASSQVGGLVSMHIDAASSSSGLALSFTESPMFISPFSSDDSTFPSPNMSYDGVLHLDTPLKKGLWTQPSAMLRGGFRYLTIVSTGQGETTISNVSTAISFMTHVEDLRNYSGYFYAQDPVFDDHNFLTKVCFYSS